MFKNFNPLNFISSDIDFYMKNTYPYWQKYVNKINMTQIDCDLKEDKDCFNRKSYEIYTFTNRDDVISIFFL